MRGKPLELGMGMLVIFLGCSAQAAEERCTFLGPLAVSAYADLLATMGKADRSNRTRMTEETEQAVNLYHQLDCPGDALNQALDCLADMVIGKTVGSDLPAALERCMTEAGMPVRR